MPTYTAEERYLWIEACHVKIEPARLPQPGRRANHLNRVILPGIRTAFAHVNLGIAIDAAIDQYPNLISIIAAATAEAAAANGQAKPVRTRRHDGFKRRRGGSP
jgi:hypothetical protein